MKCWWELKPTHEGNATYVVQESHYYNQEDGYWTRNYQIGIGVTKEAAASHMQQCRWFPRTRVALLTEQRAIYITETAPSGLEYRHYDYGQTSDQPSLWLREGVRTSDREKEMESFTFTNQIYRYIVNVSSQESRPGVQVLVKKHDSVVQEEHCLSYTYLKKY